MGISGEPSWLDRGERSLAVYVHRADGQRTRGVLVIAGPMGREGVVTFRALRALAVRAATAGFTVVRFDWTGDGESAPVPDGHGIVDCWEADLADVLTFAETLAPGARPNLVGVRLAAMLAARVPAERLSSRVLWEPRSGRAHLRYHEKLRRMSVGVPTVPDGVELVGSWYSDSDAQAIRALRVPTDGPEVLLEPNAAALASFVEAESTQSEVPWASIDHVVKNLQAGDFPAAPFTPVATHRLAVPGGAVDETFVRVGPHGLPGVLTRPVDTDVVAGVAFAPSGSEPRTGPAHLWVTAGRSLAAEGVATLRADRRGQGELMDPGATRPPNPYRAVGVEDASHTIAHLRDLLDDAPIVAAGLCAGAWTSTLAAARTPVDAVVAYNNIAWKPTAAYDGQEATPDSSFVDEAAEAPRHVRSRARARAALRHARTRMRTTKIRNWLLSGWESAKSAIARHAPSSVWKQVARVSKLEYPGQLSVRPGPGLHFHMGHADAAHFRRIKGLPAFADLRAQGIDITAQAWADLDHALLAEVSRQRALAVLADEVHSVVADDDARPPHGRKP